MEQNEAINKQICANCIFYSVDYRGVKTTANPIEEIQIHTCKLDCSSNYTTGEVSPDFGCNRFKLCK